MQTVHIYDEQLRFNKKMISPNSSVFREAPLRKLQGLFGHCPNEGGVSNPCPNGLGHLFREELSMFKGAFSYFWGV